jgi:hypothetical protein
VDPAKEASPPVAPVFASNLQAKFADFPAAMFCDRGEHGEKAVTLAVPLT